MIVYNNNSAWTAVYLGNQQISKVHSSQAKVWPPIDPIDPMDKKVTMSYKNGDVLWTDCNSSSVVTWAADINKPNHHVDDIVSAVVGDCVDTIGNAFGSASALTSVRLSDNITKFSGYSFTRCTSLTSITYPPRLTMIGEQAFQGSALRAIDIPSSVSTLGEGCYYGCASATSLSIGSGVTAIPDSAFTLCTSLTSVSIPNNITSIGISVFAFCSGLTDVTLSDNITSISERAFEQCSGLTAVTIPDNVQTIEYMSFYQCTALKNLVIGSGITEISSSSFMNCSSLSSITINATTPPIIGGRVFENTNDCPIYVPCESVEAYKTASSWSGYTSYKRRIQAIPNSCDNLFTLKNQNNNIIGSARCGSSTAITSGDVATYSSSTRTIEIGSCCDVIEDSAFKGWTAQTLSIEDGVRMLGYRAFADSSITSITIPDSVISVGNGLCSGCTSLVQASITTATTTIPQYMFSHCSALTTFDFTEFSKIDEGAFENSGLINIVLPIYIEIIEDSAFNGCSSLTSVTCLATTPPTIGSGVFSSTNNCPIYVPSESVSAYQSASGWSTYASRIQAIPTD